MNISKFLFLPKPSTNLAQKKKHLHVIYVSVSFLSSETGG